MLDLAAVDEFLLEEAELVVDPVAERGIVERRQRIEEAGGEPAEAAVAQAHVDLGIPDLLEVQAQELERLPGGLVEPGGEQIVLEEPAHEVLEREIIHPADVVRVVDALGLDHPLMDVVADGERGRDPPVAGRRRTGMARQRRGQVAQDQGPEHLHRGVARLPVGRR